MNHKVEQLGTWMRWILPVLVTCMIFMLTDIRSNQQRLCESFDGIKENLHHEVVEIKQRLTAVETLLKMRGS